MRMRGYVEAVDVRISLFLHKMCKLDLQKPTVPSQVPNPRSESFFLTWDLERGT